MGKLTDKGVKSLGQGVFGDGGGLYISVGAGTARSWLFRYKKAGKTCWLGLGSYPAIGLADARLAAGKAKKQVRDGGNPVEQKREAKRQALKAAERTFARVAELFITDHAAKWRGPKQAPQWRRSLELYAFPTIGEVQIAQLTAEKVLAVLRPIWTTKTETASRVRSRIENIWDYAAARGWASGENPARWRGRLQYALPAPEKVQPVVHYPAVPWADLPAVTQQLASSKGAAAACLRFLTLTAARSAEARGARWEEIDIAAKVWSIPADRMKGGQAHRVPLSDAALATVKAAYPPEATEKPVDGLVFPGGRVGRPLSDVALAKALRTAGAGDFTVHGLRSTFRDWAAESTAFPREICEAALAHANTNKVEAAYLRGDHFEKRARLMDAWANHATAAPAIGATVTTLRRA